jgi:ribosomal protein L37E
MATQADAYMDIQIGGKNLAICRRCGDLASAFHVAR